jgi:flavin reductase (DIM6/NTAB) family NADH-FMN oxidoreductase RutF
MLFDFEKLAPQDCYKLVVSSVVPRPIAWVVTQDEAGTVNAAPYSFFNAFSDDPVVVGFGAGPRGPGVLKDTADNIRRTGEFVVNLVPESAIHGMNTTAIDFPPGVDELAEAGLTKAPSAKIKPPRIAESPVALECVTFQLIPAGRHTIGLDGVVDQGEDAGREHHEARLPRHRIHHGDNRQGENARRHAAGQPGEDNEYASDPTHGARLL